MPVIDFRANRNFMIRGRVGNEQKPKTLGGLVDGPCSSGSDLAYYLC